MVYLDTTIVAPPLLTITVQSLILYQIRVQLLQLAGCRNVARLLVVRHPVWPGPHKLHGRPRRRHTLHGECAHGAVEGEYLEVALAGEHQVPPHRVQDCTVGVDSQRNL